MRQEQGKKSERKGRRKSILPVSMSLGHRAKSSMTVIFCLPDRLSFCVAVRWGAIGFYIFCAYVYVYLRCLDRLVPSRFFSFHRKDPVGLRCKSTDLPMKQQIDAQPTEWKSAAGTDVYKKRIRHNVRVAAYNYFRRN